MGLKKGTDLVAKWHTKLLYRKYKIWKTTYLESICGTRATFWATASPKYLYRICFNTFPVGETHFRKAGERVG